MKLIPKPTGHPIKLVRDRTPQVVNSTGTPGGLFYRRLEGTDDRMPLLKKKLGEEVTEFLIDEGFEELCDVYAVILGIAHAMGHSSDDLEKDLSEDIRGGFFNGIVMYGHHSEFDDSVEQ